MSYPARLSQSHYNRLSPFTQRMLSLSEGESFIINATVEGMKYLDYYLRAWAFSEGYEKGTFRISRLSSTSLCVTRKKQDFAYSIEDKKLDGDDTAQCFALDALQSAHSEDQAIELAHEARIQGKLTPQQAIDAIAAWHKMKGQRE